MSFQTAQEGPAESEGPHKPCKLKCQFKALKIKFSLKIWAKKKKK